MSQLDEDILGLRTHINAHIHREFIRRGGEPRYLLSQDNFILYGCNCEWCLERKKSLEGIWV